MPNETTYTINVPPFDAGSSYNSPATYAGTIAANFNAVGPLTNIQITATCHLSGRAGLQGERQGPLT